MDSCYFLDKDNNNSRILLDHKYTMKPKIYSYGLEISNKKYEYFKCIVDSYFEYSK